MLFTRSVDLSFSDALIDLLDLLSTVGRGDVSLNLEHPVLLIRETLGSKTVTSSTGLDLEGKLLLHLVSRQTRSC